MIERLSPPGSPIPLGPYSPAVRAGDFVYVSGQGPVDPVTNQLLNSDIKSETRQVLENIRSILSGVGATMADVVKCSVFIKEAFDFAAMNEVYAEFFGQDKPARSTIVCAFAAAIKVEIDCVAYRPKETKKENGRESDSKR